jgi:hypothetical protein
VVRVDGEEEVVVLIYALFGDYVWCVIIMYGVLDYVAATVVCCMFQKRHWPIPAIQQANA